MTREGLKRREQPTVGLSSQQLGKQYACGEVMLVDAVSSREIGFLVIPDICRIREERFATEHDLRYHQVVWAEGRVFISEDLIRDGFVLPGVSDRRPPTRFIAEICIRDYSSIHSGVVGVEWLLYKVYSPTQC